MADWRLEQLEMHGDFRGFAFQRKKYREYRPGWDHDHCIACNTKLAEFESDKEIILHEGYASTEDVLNGADYYWVCPECFALFKEEMDWSEMSTP